jgi:hypothetical protein
VDLRNSDCTASRRIVEEEGAVADVGAEAATTLEPVGLRTSASAPNVADVLESDPKTTLVMAAAT